MTRNDISARRHLRPWTAAALCLALANGGCGLHDVVVPAIDGPSEEGISLQLTVSKDILVADGGDFAVVTATVRGPDGKGAANRDVFFTIADANGSVADIGVIVGSNGPGTGATVRTNAQGIAQVIYEAPPRTDFTGNRTVLVKARIVGSDVNGQFYHQVRIELRSAEPRIFPNPAPNGAASCSFIVEPAVGPFFVGQVIGFHSTSTGSIIRYEWDFGDKTTGDAPDQAHVYRAAGTYTVIHVVTDGRGFQSKCAAIGIPVVAR